MLMNENDHLIDLSVQFAVNVVNYYRWLVLDQKEYVISQQLVKYATNAGATIHKTFYESDRIGFHKNIENALEFIVEADCCLALLERTGYSHSQFHMIRKQSKTLQNMLTSILISYQSPEIIGVAR